MRYDIQRSRESSAPVYTPGINSVQSVKLREAIKEYEANKWKVIGQKVGKPAKVSDTRLLEDLVASADSFLPQACEQYAKEHFKSL